MLEAILFVSGVLVILFIAYQRFIGRHSPDSAIDEEQLSMLKGKDEVSDYSITAPYSEGRSAVDAFNTGYLAENELYMNKSGEFEPTQNQYPHEHHKFEDKHPSEEYYKDDDHEHGSKEHLSSPSQKDSPYVRRSKCHRLHRDYPLPATSD